MKAKKLYQKKPKRLGRGGSSGHGGTSTKGHKGQKARSGYSRRAGFEGGQNPLWRKLPKRGFSREALKERFLAVNLHQLSELSVSSINPEVLVQNGVIRKKEASVKILGTGEIQKAITVSAHAFSASAKTKIEAAGGKAVLIEA